MPGAIAVIVIDFDGVMRMLDGPDIEPATREFLDQPNDERRLASVFPPGHANHRDLGRALRSVHRVLLSISMPASASSSGVFTLKNGSIMRPWNLTSGKSTTTLA